MNDAGTITSRELAASLGTTPQRVGSWIRKGMPTRSRNGVYRMDPDEVESWLIEQGMIKEAIEPEKPAGRVVANRCDVAKHFGVNEHTVSAWQRRDGFPGKPASPGKKDGYYPLDEIAQWRDETILKNDPAQRGETDGANGETHDEAVKSERAKLLRIQRAERELNLAHRRGELIQVADVTSCLERLVNQSGAIIDEIPDRVLSYIPDSVSDDSKRAIRGDLTQLVMDVRIILGELVDGDRDESTADSMENGVEA